MCMWQWQWHRTSMQMLQVPWCILIFSLIWIETFRTWGFSHFQCWKIAVGFFLAANLPFFDTQTCHDWGRSQQCTSQDKLCLFATWLEVRFSPSQYVAKGHWNESIFHRLSNVPRFSRFSLKIPCILKHRGSSWHCRWHAGGGAAAFDTGCGTCGLHLSENLWLLGA